MAVQLESFLNIRSKYKYKGIASSAAENENKITKKKRAKIFSLKEKLQNPQIS